MLEIQYCRTRLGRIAGVCSERKIDAVVLGAGCHVYYSTGHRVGWLNEAAVVVFADGESVLISANQPSKASAADRNLVYEGNWMGTARSDQPTAVAEKVLDELKGKSAKRIGVDASAVGGQVAMRFDGDSMPIDDVMHQLRRVKDPDELQLMRQAIALTSAMYVRAREIIEPGVSEIDVFTQLQSAAVKAAGEPLWPMHLGNDYRAAAGGGPPRNDRRAQAGELYILDLGPAYRGYFSDNARTICVDRRPTDEQMKAWRDVVDALRIVEQMARPGVRCADIFRAVDDHFRARRGTGMSHHLGHGVGLSPHEFPHLNPRWDDVLMEGEVFTAEPGVYHESLRAGIRLENQYLVTSDGVENLVPSPLGLT